MQRNFTICPHCAAKGRQRVIRPATRRTPLVSRSDGNSFHLFLEESYVRPAPGGTGFEIVALFRYDLDPAGLKGESSLVLVPAGGGFGDQVLGPLEQAADRLAAILAGSTELRRQYTWESKAS